MRPVFAVLLAICGIGSVGSALAQARNPAPAAPDFGTTGSARYLLGYADFTANESTAVYRFATSADYAGRASTADGYYSAFPHLPTGARLVSYGFNYCDSSTSDHIVLRLLDCNVLGGDCSILVELRSVSSSRGTGCRVSSFDISALNYTVQNSSRELIAYMFIPVSLSTVVFTSASIGYALQVSPGPATATFADVPTTSPQFRFVEALYAAGITVGCGNGDFCPNAPVTRGQMAVFLASALGLEFPN